MLEIIFCSCSGCLIRYINLYKYLHKISFVYLVLDLLVAIFIGYLTSRLFQDAEVSYNTTLVVATILGNAGSRALFVFKRFINHYINFTLFDEEPKDGSKRD